MEVNHMGKWEEGEPGDVTVIFVNSKEGVEALRRLEARIEKARREGKIIPPEERRRRHETGESLDQKPDVEKRARSGADGEDDFCGS
jgi:hypothetical protein